MPTQNLTNQPTLFPTTAPTVHSTKSPTVLPSISPSLAPSQYPTNNPSFMLAANSKTFTQWLKNNLYAPIWGAILGLGCLVSTCYFYTYRDRRKFENKKFAMMSTQLASLTSTSTKGETITN